MSNTLQSTRSVALDDKENLTRPECTKSKSQKMQRQQCGTKVQTPLASQQSKIPKKQPLQAVN